MSESVAVGMPATAERAGLDRWPLYTIGDVVSALNQISVAVGHAAVAATLQTARVVHVDERADPLCQVVLFIAECA